MRIALVKMLCPVLPLPKAVGLVFLLQTSREQLAQVLGGATRLRLCRQWEFLSFWGRGGSHWWSCHHWQLALRFRTGERDGFGFSLSSMYKGSRTAVWSWTGLSYITCGFGVSRGPVVQLAPGEFASIRQPPQPAANFRGSAGALWKL